MIDVDAEILVWVYLPDWDGTGMSWDQAVAEASRRDAEAAEALKDDAKDQLKLENVAKAAEICTAALDSAVPHISHTLRTSNHDEQINKIMAELGY